MLELKREIKLEEISDYGLDCLVNYYILESLNDWLSDASLSFTDLSASSKKELWGEITKRVLGEN